MRKIASMDVVILSNAHLPLLKEYTDQTILTCNRSDHSIEFNFVVIEQQNINYSVPTYHLNEPFNYNKFMNFGISKGNSEYIALCNNDLLFGRMWATNIISAMRRHELLSACPFDPQHHRGARRRWEEINYGYAVTMEMAGWCIVIKRELLSIIGEIKWHPELPFWYSDNIYARQLEKHGIKHALVKNSLVTHRGSQTIKRSENVEAWTSGSWPLFDHLCKEGVL